MSFEKAMDDYRKITVIAEFNQEARKMLKEAQERMYEINRETVAPEIAVISPAPLNDTVEVRGGSSTLLITGKIKDKSKVKSFTINNENIVIAEKNGEFEFLSNISVAGLDKITMVATDDYDNVKTVTYGLFRTEINPPKIQILAPYASDDGQKRCLACSTGTGDKDELTFAHPQIDVVERFIGTVALTDFKKLDHVICRLPVSFD